MWVKGVLPPFHPWGKILRVNVGEAAPQWDTVCQNHFSPQDPSPRSCTSWLLAAEDPQGGSVTETEMFLLLIQCKIIAWICVRKSSPWSSFGDMAEGMLHFWSDKAIYPSFCRRKPWISFKTWQWCILVHDEERNCKKLSGVVRWIFFFFSGPLQGIFYLQSCVSDFCEFIPTLSLLMLVVL